jgi:hypothetical protein
MPNICHTIKPKGDQMIINNSIKLLEQLSDLEEKIQKYEKLMDALGIEFDREKLLMIITRLN